MTQVYFLLAVLAMLVAVNVAFQGTRMTTSSLRRQVHDHHSFLNFFPSYVHLTCFFSGIF